MMQNSVDIVIAGAGPAGIAAALSAARCGCRVLLVEQREQIGGTVTASLIHTIGGLYDDRGELLNPGLSAELAKRLTDADSAVVRRRIGKTWCLAVDPSLFGQVTGDWLREEEKITLLTDSTVTGGVLGDRTAVRLDLLCRGQAQAVTAGNAIDATGDASLVRLLAPGTVIDPAERASAGLIFRLRGCQTQALAFPRGVEFVRSIRTAASEGRLSPIAGSAWLDSGVVEDEIYVKLTLPMESDGAAGELKRLTESAEQARLELLAFLKKLPAFQEARCTASGTLGLRDGGRITGETVLTEDDLLGCRRWADVACKGAWPLEYWDQEQGVTLRYLPGGSSYDIPLSCLKVAGFPQLWAAGKCLSAEPRAQASARVAGCCWAMGEAAGRGAAKTINEGRVL